MVVAVALLAPLCRGRLRMERLGEWRGSGALSCLDNSWELFDAKFLLSR